MTSQSPILFLGIDAGNPSLLRRYVEAGELPNLARVVTAGNSATMEHEPGLYVGSIWPTLLTGVGVDRHGFYSGTRPAPRSYEYIRSPVEVEPFWAAFSRAGRRVAVVDAPFFPAIADIEADQLIEWGCHDRYWGPSSHPPELLAEIVSKVGRHPIGMIDHDDERFAPCDWIHATDRKRSAEERRRLLADLDLGSRARISLATTMHQRGSYDLYVDIVGETHCAGHHLWDLHDPTHPTHDAALRAEVGDPLLPTFRRTDELLGVHLSAMGPRTTVFILASHGMRSHYDGTHILDEMLWRLDQKYRGEPRPWMGPRTRRLEGIIDSARAWGATRATQATGALVTRSLGRRSSAPTTPSNIPGPGRRLWYQIDNNTVSGAVRFNRLGREPEGLLDRGLLDHAEPWLIDELRRVINLDTGRRVVTDAFLSETLYRRDLDDGLPDLIVEWARDAPIERIWSPSFGMISAPYVGLRTGDHDGSGELFVMGPEARPHAPISMKPVDLAPTIAAAAGVALLDCDGTVLATLTGAAEVDEQRKSPATDRIARPLAGTAASVTSLRRSLLELRHEVNGLRAAHHATRVCAEDAAARASVAAEVIATTSWIGAQRVEEDVLISVILPTLNRSRRLSAAIESVLTQRYANLELIIVNDGSTDETESVLAGVSDNRVSVTTNPSNLGEGASRNVGLVQAKGDIVCFLDDDNEFHHDWLRNVAWLFQTRDNIRVAYGARLIDDVNRLRTGLPGGPPHIELNEWDDEVNAERCLVDVNVLAHRRSAVRFDPSLPLFTDWVYLSELASSDTPARLAVIATRYATDSPDRVTRLRQDRYDELYEAARSTARERVSQHRIRLEGRSSSHVCATSIE